MPIENFRTETLKSGRFIKPLLARYSQDGVANSWEIVESKDSVAVLIYDRELEAFVFVRQFRPAVYHRNAEGYTVELCAGLVDKPLPPIEIAREEIDEECGYRVSAEKIEKITAFYTSVGFAGACQTLYYAEVDRSMKAHDGGGIEGEESIEIVYIPVDEAYDFIFDENIAKTPGLMFAVMWWMDKFQK